MAASGSGSPMAVEIPDMATLSLARQDHESDVDASSESMPSEHDPSFRRVWENGRQYANDAYILPDDPDEATRLSIEHQAFLLLLDRKLSITFFPTSSPLRILDIGTGPGDWAIAAALKYPNSQIIATDISAEVGSAAGHVPSNLSFQIDDARSVPWTFATDCFDFIHMRGLAGAFTEQELAGIYSEIYRCLKPHGSFEMMDFGAISLPGLSPSSGTPSSQSAADPSASSSSAAPPALSAYNTALASAASNRGLSGLLDLRHARTELLETAGLRVQRSLKPSVALGEWSASQRDHRIGRMAAVAMLEGLEARGLRLLTRDAGLSEERARELIEQVKAEVSTEGARPMVHVQVTLAKNLDGSWGST